MWVLESKAKQFDNNNVRYLIYKCQIYSIGRKDCDILIKDNSVSRLHAKLILEKSSNEKGGETQLVLKDNGSKFGTFINTIKVIANSETHLHHGDVIEFGIHHAELKISYSPLLVISSFLQFSEKQLLSVMVSDLGGEFLDEWPDNKNVTVLIQNHLEISRKTLLAMVNLVPIVSDSWITALQERKKLTQPLPQYSDHLPDTNATLWPPEFFHVQPNRKTVFLGYTFIFLSVDQYEKCMDIIHHGGGYTILWDTLKGGEKFIKNHLSDAFVLPYEEQEPEVCYLKIQNIKNLLIKYKVKYCYSDFIGKSVMEARVDFDTALAEEENIEDEENEIINTKENIQKNDKKDELEIPIPDSPEKVKEIEIRDQIEMVLLTEEKKEEREDVKIEIRQSSEVVEPKPPVPKPIPPNPNPVVVQEFPKIDDQQNQQNSPKNVEKVKIDGSNFIIKSKSIDLTKDINEYHEKKSPNKIDYGELKYREKPKNEFFDLTNSQEIKETDEKSEPKKRKFSTTSPQPDSEPHKRPKLSSGNTTIARSPTTIVLDSDNKKLHSNKKEDGAQITKSPSKSVYVVPKTPEKSVKKFKKQKILTSTSPISVALVPPSPNKDRDLSRNQFLEEEQKAEEKEKIAEDLFKSKIQSVKKKSPKTSLV